MRRLTLADLLLLLTVLIWGLNVSIVKLLLGTFHPLGLSMLRFFIVVGVFAVLVPARERTVQVERRYLPLLVAAGLCGIFVNQVAFTYGLQNTTAASVTMLITTIPIFAGLGSFLLGWERPGWQHWGGILISFVGVGLIVLGNPKQPGHAASLLGDLLALLTAASWAGYSLLLRPLMEQYSAAKISLYAAVVGVLTLLPLGLPQLMSTHFASISPGRWLLVLYSSVGAVVLTNIFWYTGVHRLGPSRATVYAYIQPLAGLFFAAVILGERLVFIQLLGGAAILAGIVFGRRGEVAA